MYLISDFHGDVDTFHRLMLQCPSNVNSVICLGDMGFGFPEFDVESFYRLMMEEYRNKTFYLIQGNHDNPECIMEKGNVRIITTDTWHKFAIVDGFNVLMIPGAYSYDKSMRVPGVSWWNTEEMSYIALENLLLNWNKADVILSHDAPLASYFNFFPETKISKTNAALDGLLVDIVRSGKNVRWFHGHLHFGYTQKLKNLQLTGIAIDSSLLVI